MDKRGNVRDRRHLSGTTGNREVSAGQACYCLAEHQGVGERVGVGRAGQCGGEAQNCWSCAVENCAGAYGGCWAGVTGEIGCRVCRQGDVEGGAISTANNIKLINTGAGCTECRDGTTRTDSGERAQSDAGNRLAKCDHNSSRS